MGRLVSYSNNNSCQSKGYCKCHVKGELGSRGKCVREKAKHVECNKEEYERSE